MEKLSSIRGGDADLNIKSNPGRNALMMAANYEDYGNCEDYGDIIKYLHLAGADLNIGWGQEWGYCSDDGGRKGHEDIALLNISIKQGLMLTSGTMKGGPFLPRHPLRDTLTLSNISTRLVQTSTS